MKYKLKYWFEHGGGCLWSENEVTKARFGYPVAIEKLPLTSETVKRLYQLEEEYSSYLNWDDPASPSLWTKEQKSDFLCRAQKIQMDLVKELGDDYEIMSEVSSCVH